MFLGHEARLKLFLKIQQVEWGGGRFLFDLLSVKHTVVCFKTSTAMIKYST